ncbi:MAG: cytochrome c [Burkholderiales bacterium]
MTYPVLAQAQKQDHKITFRAIMQDLRAGYLQLTNALFTDDFKVLEESAKAIEGHPLPGDLVTAIRSKLGKNFRAFEAVDERSHQAATELAKRAAANDPSGSAKAFGRLADACVSCHKQFRATLRPLSD